MPTSGEGISDEVPHLGKGKGKREGARGVGEWALGSVGFGGFF